MNRRSAFQRWTLVISAALGFCTCCVEALGQQESRQATQPEILAPGPLPPRSLVEPGPAPTETVASSKLTEEQIQARLESAQNASDLPKETQTEVVRLFNSALGYLRAARLDTQRATSFQDLVVTAPRQTAEIREGLLAAAAEQPVLPEALTRGEATLESLEQALVTYRSALSTAEADLAKAEQVLSDERAKPQSLQTRLITRRVRLAEIEEELSSLNAVERVSLVVEARRTELTAEREATLASIRAIEQERVSHDARTRLLEARRDWDRHTATRLRQDLEKLQEIVNARRRSEAQRERIEAERARLDTGDKHPLVQSLAEGNAQFSEKQLAVVSALERTQMALREASLRLDQITSDTANAPKMLEAAGLSEEFGRIVRKRRGDLPSELEYKKDAADRKQVIAQTGLDQLLVEDELERLADLDARVEALLQERDLLPTVRDSVRPEVRKLLTARQALLATLKDRYQEYVTELGNLNEKEADLVKKAQDYAKLLDERLLQIRSAPPINRQTFRDAVTALAWLVGWETVWGPVWETCRALAQREPVLWGVAGAAYLAVVLWSFRLRRYLRSIHDRVGEAAADSFAVTVEAMVITMILALPLPALVLFVTWQLQASLMTPDAVRAVAAGAGAAMVTFLLLRAFHLACHPGGLFACHFGWTQRTVALLRRAALLMLVTAVPTRFVLSTLNAQESMSPDTAEAYVNSLGRLGFIAVMFIAGMVVLRLLKPSSGIAANLIRHHPEGWVARLRYLWYPAAVGVWFVLGLMAGAGYFYTAQQLGSGRLQATLWLVVGALLAREMLVRWLLVSHRRAESSTERDRARIDLTRPRRGETPVITEPADPFDPMQIDAKMHQLLRALVGCTLLVGLWLIWSSVLPALSVLKTQFIPGSETITWQQLLTALAILGITLVLSRDVPSVLEIAILQRLPLNAGERYAVSTISRYLITILGVVYAFGQVSIGWEQVQWLVAAMAVGLGFGLQEIFGNFISGLIILFEQPIRLGDRVTVGNTVGTVSRIRIRATTITDRDRRELIIPNKEFITGQVTNWTLSNPMTRVLIPVGIAYGSDRQKARELLLESVRTCPLVMDDPEPEVFFVGFGDSALNFQVRAFVKHVWQRTPARDAIHENIDRLFRENGITIPFPQRDLHLRSADVGVTPREPAETYDLR